MAASFLERASGRLSRLPNPYWMARLALAARSGSTVSVEFNAPLVGFFAHLSWCLQFASFCDLHGARPAFRIVSPQYRDPQRSANWLEYFFDIPPVEHADLRLKDLNQIQLEKRSHLDSMMRGAEMRRRFLPLRPELLAKLDRTVAEKMGGHKVLGIHFRGTDKVEAQRVAWPALDRAVTGYLQSHPEIDCLYLASDENAFFEHMAQTFPDVRQVQYEDTIRSTDGQQFHLVDHGANNYLKGEEALMNCLLLSRCNALIRSSSALSAWASIFNPELPFIMLNKPRAESLWYPETVLIEHSIPIESVLGEAAAVGV